MRASCARSSELLAPLGIDCVGAAELGLPEPEEIGDTFVDNADLKAREAADLSGLPALADDSGLAVDALHGAPASSRARWAEDEAGNRDFGRAMERVWREVEAAGDGSAGTTPISLCARRSPGPTTGRAELRRPGRRHAHLAAAGRQGLRLRPDVHAGRP